MGKRTICPLTCPMINSQGFCESAWTRASQVTECPHRKMRETVSNLNTGNEKQQREPEAYEPRADRLPEMVLSALSVFAL